MQSLFIFSTSCIISSLTIRQILLLPYVDRHFKSAGKLRENRDVRIPNFAGIAISIAILFSSSLFIPEGLIPKANLFVAAGLVIFMTGLRDDIVGITPAFKFVFQFFSAIIVSVLADVRVETLDGLFGYQEINYYSSIGLTVLFMVGIMNAYNLIDGIDGLAGTLGLICSFCYAVIFFNSGDLGFFYLSLSLAGGLLGFLFFNITPAKIFMGDSGSLVLGFFASIFSMKFLLGNSMQHLQIADVKLNSGFGVVLAILVIPIFDTLRVFTLRILKNKSPFTADSNHLHHRLLFLGLSHIQATFILALSNILFIVLALSLQDMSAGQIISIIMLVALTANGLLSLYIERYKKLLFSPSKSDPAKFVSKTAGKNPAMEKFDKLFKN